MFPRPNSAHKQQIESCDRDLHDQLSLIIPQPGSGRDFSIQDIITNYVHELNKKLYSILAECTGNKMT